MSAWDNPFVNWQRLAENAALTAGILGYLASGILYFGSGLVMPFAMVPLMWAIWLAGVWAAARVAKERSLWVLASGPVAVLLWMGIVSVGEWLFGWTA